MKTTILLLLLFIAFEVKAQIPDVEARNINQEWESIRELQGEKITVIDFWATWCKPCVTAIPKLNNIYNRFEEEGVQFIGINVDGPRNQSKVKPFAKTLEIKYPVLLDPDQELVNDFNVNVFPTLLIFDENGDKVFVHEGFNSGDEEIINGEIQKLLAR